MTVPAEVAAITSQYLELIDKTRPGLVRGFYLTGSIPLGDYSPGRSDIDGVVVVSEPVTDPEVVRAVHAKLPERPYFDVTYLTASALAAEPDRSTPVVYTIDGQFQDPAAAGSVTPVLWSELARQSIAVRAVDGLVVHDDHEALVDHTRDNLTSYWVPMLDRLDRAMTDRPVDQPLDGRIVSWVVLGISRLHALLATGNIISKTAAGEHARARFPAYSALCTQAITHRAGHGIPLTSTDGTQTVAFGRAVITSAQHL
ncbi:nucleotidyltransferase domain-containing protein [Kribbella sp. NPDC050820]|uniref:nucleotidyltransferase domain-containing protein n=1 Tax=Kribbella sp. NPDC050820 TaxID=3155408 RepID=UPI0033CEE43F